jgi:hypothetical protein
MATSKPFSFNGNLKGEVLLANGSRVLFDAPKWEFSYPAMHNSGYCTIKAEECPSDQRSGIHIDGKHFAQSIREMQNQSIKINVNLTEEGKRAVKEAVLSSKDEYGRSPIVDLFQQEELKSRIAHREMLLEDTKKLLELYSEACPWEDDLGASKDHLVGCIDNLKKEPTPKKANERDPIWEIVKELAESNGTEPGSVGRCCVFCNAKDDSLSNLRHKDTCIISRAYKLAWHKQYKEPVKKQETYSFANAIDEARKVQGHNIPLVITNGEFLVRCQFASGSRYIVFKNKECAGIYRHTDDIADMHNPDIFKGWYPAGPDDVMWARSQSLTSLIDKLKAPKKQEESTALFDVISKAVLQHSGRVFTAQNSWDDAIVRYRVISNTWELTTAISSSKDPTALTQDALQSLARKYQINLSKGWRMFNVSGVRG